MLAVAQYTPSEQDAYRFARILGYRAILSVNLLYELSTIVCFAFLASFATVLITGESLSNFVKFVNAITIVSVVLIFWIVFVLWQLASVWLISAQIDEPKPTPITILRIPNGLRLESEHAMIELLFDKIIIFFVHDDFIAMKQQRIFPFLLEIKHMDSETICWISDSLLEKSHAMTFFNAHKMLNG